MFKMIAIGLMLLMTASLGYTSDSKPKDNELLIRKIFADVIENPNYDESIYRKYFSDDYHLQNGNVAFDFQGFLDHMKAQKKHKFSIKVVFDHIVATENRVATVHRVFAERPDHTKIVTKLIAMFEIKDGRITSCDELAHVLVGNPEDKALSHER